MLSCSQLTADLSAAVIHARRPSRCSITPVVRAARGRKSSRAMEPDKVQFPPIGSELKSAQQRPHPNPFPTMWLWVPSPWSITSRSATFIRGAQAMAPSCLLMGHDGLAQSPDRLCLKHTGRYLPAPRNVHDVDQSPQDRRKSFDVASGADWGSRTTVEGDRPSGPRWPRRRAFSRVVRGVKGSMGDQGNTGV